MRKVKQVPLTCSECGETFVGSESQGWKSAKGKNVFCGPICISVLSSRTASHTNTMYASARMTKNNPMTRLASLRKMKRTLKRIAHKPPVRGGNGTGLSPAERVLSEATGLQPYIVPTRTKRSEGYPTHYKLDLADPERMLGIEIDGASHGLLSRQAQDRKKEKFLRSLGWTIIRFTNQQAIEETKKCCDLIRRIA